MKKPAHSMSAKEPRRPRGSPASCASCNRPCRARSPARSSGIASAPCAAWSTRPPGESTWLSKLKSSGPAPAAPRRASWQDMPPPETMPAHSAGTGPRRPGCSASLCSTASHSARASSWPLSTLRRARSPKKPWSREAKASSCGRESSPFSRALRTPPVAPSSTRPLGNCSCRSPSSAVSRSSLCSADARASPRQLDFSQLTAGSLLAVQASLKQIARVEPLPQSTTAMGMSMTGAWGMGLSSSERMERSSCFRPACRSAFSNSGTPRLFSEPGAVEVLPE
mmetsp:Transcript_61784/g.199210  ORF Transcript_61784/g.199210 Transcript_61784/m.199210 type:complete len:281 (+) Transcript_61784:389-1231(+)